MLAARRAGGGLALAPGGARHYPRRPCCRPHSGSGQQPKQPQLSTRQLATSPMIGAAAGFITASVRVGAAAVQVPLLTAS